MDSHHRSAERRAKWFIAFALLLFVSSVAPVLAVASGEGNEESPPSKEAPAPSAAELAEFESKESEYVEWLSSPEAIEQRDVSQGAYGSLSASEARSLILEAFPGQINALNADPARVLSELEVEQSLGTYAALVSDDDERAIIESSVPVESNLSGEGQQPVDLSLEQSAGDFVSENPLTEVRLPGSAEKPIQLQSGLKVDLPASDDHSALGLGDKNLFYPETETATDTLVSPIAAGVEVFEQLRSPESPEQFRFALDLPPGVELRGTEAGGAEILSASEEKIGEVPPPGAVDAQGTVVPVTMGIEGEELLLEVPHRSRELAYPLLLDPQFLEEGYVSYNNWAPGWNDAYVLSNTSSLSAIAKGSSYTYGANTHGHWAYTAPGQTTYIAAATFYSDNFSVPENCTFEQPLNQPHGYAGLYNPSTGGYVGLGLWSGGSGYSPKFETQWVGSPGVRQVIAGIGTGTTSVHHKCAFTFTVGGVTIQEKDPEAPTIDSVSGISTKWVKDLTATAYVSDPGLGVKGVTLSPSGSLPHTIGSCSGTYTDRCASSEEASFGVGYFAEGERSASISAYDPLGPDDEAHVSSSYKWTTKIDRSKPEVELEGQLTEAIEEAKSEGEVSNEEVPQLSLPVYNVKIEAEDGSDAEDKTKRSGMKNIAIFVDGKEIEVSWKAQECPNSSCTMTETYPLRLNGLEGGPVHVLTAVAEDQVGNQREREIEFEYIPATGMKDEYVMQHFPLPDGEGNEEDEEFPKRPELAVNVTNGNLVYRQKDVEVPGAEVDLELERFYNSQLPEEDNTEWGDGWTLAQTPEFEPEETKEEAPPATARVRRSSGSLVSSVGLPTESGDTQFDKKLGATVTKEPGGGYTVEDQSGETETSLVFDSTGKVQEETTSGYAKIEYSYEKGYLSELAVDDPTSIGGTPEEPGPGKGEAGEAGEFEAPAYFTSFGGASSGPGKLSAPAGIATDAEGHVWVADTGHSRIQEFDAEGEFISQFGADGASDGQFFAPRGIAVDSKGNIWVSDSVSSRVQEFNAKGEYVRKFGSYGTGNGKFNSLRGLAVDAAGHVWAVNAASGKSRVQEFSPEGTYLSQFGTSGSENGQLMEPEGIALDAKGNIWIADTGNNRIQEFNAKGEYVRKFGSLGTGNGQLKSPSALAFDGEGNVWVTDAGNNRLEEFSPEGTYLAQFGAAGNKAAQFSEPHGIAIDAKGHAWVADTGNDRVQESTASEFVRKFGGEGSEGGQLSHPSDAAFDSQGNLWVLDEWHNRVQKFDPEGKFLDEFGAKGTGDGLMLEPSGLSVDSEGNVWVADAGNYRIQEFNSKGEFIRKFGSKGTGNGKFTWLEDVAVDPEGRVWAVDVSSTVSRVEKFNSKGEYLAKFGSGWGTGNGQLWNPRSITADSKGNLWVSDSSNYRIQEFNSKFEYVRKFGSGQGSGNGQFKEMHGVAVGPEGNVWVADSQNNRIQEFSGEGAYLGQFGTVGNNDGQFLNPQGVAVDSKGNVWIADTANNRVQEIAGSEFIRKFGGDSSGAGHLSGPEGVAADSEGDVWAVDSGHSRIQEFSASGKFIRQFSAPGSGDGQLSSARGIAFDPEGNAWIADTGNHRIEEFNSKGEYVRKFGSAGKEGGQFESVEDVAIDAEGHLWTVESSFSSSGPRVQEFTKEGKFIRQFGSHGIGNGEFEYSPEGIAIDAKGNVWVADTNNNRLQEFNSQGEFIAKFGTEGTGNGQFKHPTDLSFDSEGNLWVVDSTNDRVQVFSAEGEYLDQFGAPGAGDGQLDTPQAINVDGQGNVWIADGGNDRIERWQIPRLAMKHDSVYVSSLGESGSGDGQLDHPGDVALDSEGNVWVADEQNDRIAEFDPAGEFIQTFGQAGTANGDLNRPASLAIDANGDILVADAGNSRIQKFSPEGKYLSKFGSNGGEAGQFREPEGIAVDAHGNIWVSDTYNGRVQEFDEEGKFIRVVGSYGFDPGQMGEPTGIDIGPGGNVWIADWLADRVVEFGEKGKFIRQFGTEGIENGQFKHPDALAINDRGQLWVADEGGDRVQAFTEEGEYVAQLGTKGTDEGQFEFGYPVGMTTDSDGSLWIADSGNDRVQRWGVYNYVPADEEPVTDHDPSVEIQSTNGLVESVEGEQAGETTYEHKGELLTAVDGPQGETEYEYDSEGRMTKVTLPNGTWGKVVYGELDGRVKSVTVDPAGDEPAKTTSFTYQDSPSRRTTVSSEGMPTIVYDIGQDGSVLKWSTTNTLPEIELITGTLYEERGEIHPEPISPGDQALRVVAHSWQGIASIQIVANGDQLVAERDCEESTCVKLEKELVTETENWPPGILQFEVIVTDTLGQATSERFWDNIPYVPPPDPEAPVAATFEQIKDYRLAHGLDLDLNPVTQEQEFNERIFALIAAWHNPHTPDGEVARFSSDEWGVPMRQRDVTEMEYREWYLASDIPKIEEWGEAHSSIYSGFEVDHPAGGIVRVGFTDSPSGHLDELKQELSAIPADRLVAYLAPKGQSVASLEQLMKEVSDSLDNNSALGENVTTVSIDTMENVVRVGAQNVAQVENALQALFGKSAPIQVVAESAATPLSTSRMKAGENLRVREKFSGNTYFGNCTAGYGAFMRVKEQNGNRVKKPFLLTAGHCSEVGQPVQKYKNPHGTVNYFGIGEVTRSSWPGWRQWETDALAVKLDGILPPKYIFRVGSEPHKVTRPGHVHKGDELCFSGVYTEKVSCGPATGGYVLPEAYKFATKHGKHWVMGFSADCRHGDSGAPVWDKTTHLVVGLLTDETESRNFPDVWSFSSTSYATLLLRPLGKAGKRIPGIFGEEAFKNLHLVEAK